jgi:hypothetical protein
VFDAHGRQGRWINMLQDFSFKIVHRPGLRHTNVDALSRNPVGPAMEDDDFCEEIQDIGNAQTDTHKEGRHLLFVQIGTKMEWFGIRRRDRESVQHHTCCFGINHSVHLSSHHLYVIDVISEDDQPQELVPCEVEDRKGDEIVQNNAAMMILQRKRPHYYDKQQ